MKIIELLEDEFEPQGLSGTDNILAMSDKDIKEMDNKVVNLIKTNGNDWWDQTQNGKYVAWRGIQTFDDPLAMVVNVRQDRKPLGDSGEGSSKKMHQMYVSAFNEAGFKANRNNSLFTSGSKAVADSYGKDSFVVIPIGDYAFTWSDKVRDLYAYIEARILFYENYSDYLRLVKLNIIDFDADIKNKVDKVIEEIRHADYIPDTKLRYKRRREYEQDIENLISDYLSVDNINYDKLVKLISSIYQSDNIIAAIESGNEIMIHCKKALLLNRGYYHEKIRPMVNG